MDIRELRYIIGIACARNMTKAAENLFVTQPALSKMLKKVEEQIGIPLFFRDGNSMIPTDAGLCVVERGRKIVNEFDALEKTLSDMKNMSSERVMLGIPPVIAALDFRKLLCVSAGTFRTLPWKFTNSAQESSRTWFWMECWTLQSACILLSRTSLAK